ncbi:peptidase M56 BlaR1 [Syntrophobotulus glycolicus DSM 8271]|uniref:Peptidase M56 BlaR1 n=1 Tax=Syntrophobotulus glycolicus (strain DSM 8271 / FlGlyR) TaxID=645991 RepID=F0SV91_SYNGF|nr:M56 family metallopeptidase [Syntrophobotulus glycolicus]ADY55591.1 peptidase M56 BlaR1 [Syntrophobotulus glycolicus DSM 8271]
MMVFISGFFDTIFEMSAIASIVALIVMVVRLALKKAPKVFSLMLWLVVFFRLLCPFTIQSSYGLSKLLPNSIKQNVDARIPVTMPVLPVGTEEHGNITHVLSNSVPHTILITSQDLFFTLLDTLRYMWLFGFIAVVLYGFISYMLLKRRMRIATKVDGNIYETDRIKTPFILGFLRPKIYIPAGLAGSELAYILKHEQTHIKRYDYLLKPIAFFAVALHWFNPVAWISYILMSHDMELSADESVMKQAGEEDIRKAYSTSLVRLSSVQSGLFPLAFGEIGVKSRVKNILNYKKPTFWVSIVSLIAVIGIGGFLMTNDEAKDINDSLAWANNLSVNDVQSIEMVISPSERENYYKEFSSEEFGPIIKIINASKGQKVNAPDELGSTTTLYIITKEGTVHTYQNLRNAYLVIDNVYLSANSSWLASSFKDLKGDASLPDGFFERVTGITTTYSLMKLGKNGEVLSSLTPLDGTYRRLAEDTVFSSMTKSTIYPAQNIDSFDAYYMLRVIYSSNNSNTTHDYYLFTMNGDAYMQNGKNGFNTKVDTELYNRIDTLLKSFN